MSNGCTCPECGSRCMPTNEQYQANGTWVTYTCTNGNCPNYVRSGNRWQSKQFESK